VKERARPPLKFSPGSFIVARALMSARGKAQKEIESLKLLEKKIAKFLERHDEVQHEKAALARQLKERERQFARMSGRLKRFEHQRREARNRLQRILGRLEELDLQ